MSRFRGQVQGFVVGAAVMAGLMLGLPALVAPAPEAPPLGEMDKLADTFGVEIVWSEDVPPTWKVPIAEDRYFTLSSSRIYVSPKLADELKRHTVLHEIGHVAQARLRLPLNECGADMFAQSLGSDMGDYCPPQSD